MNRVNEWLIEMHRAVEGREHYTREVDRLNASRPALNFLNSQRRLAELKSDGGIELMVGIIPRAQALELAKWILEVCG